MSATPALPGAAALIAGRGVCALGIVLGIVLRIVLRMAA